MNTPTPRTDALDAQFLDKWHMDVKSQPFAEWLLKYGDHARQLERELNAVTHTLQAPPQNAAPQAATGTVPPESSAPAVAAPQPSAIHDTSPQVSHTTHDWQPDGGVLRFELHPGGEAPHVHTTCAKCGARAWFLEYQWELLTKVCA